MPNLPYGTVTQSDLLYLEEQAALATGAPREVMLTVCPSLTSSLDDEFGWNNGDPIVQFEEGEYNWPIIVCDNPDVQTYLKSRGLFVEPINTWALGVYPL